MKTLAQMMADFTFELSYDAVPDEVMVATRRHLADTVACALGAHNTPAAQALQKYAIGKGGRADATIIGTDEKVPAGLAALVNGTMVRYLDANDIFVLGRGGASGHFSDGTSGPWLLPSNIDVAARNCLPAWWRPTSFKAPWRNASTSGTAASMC